MFSASRSTRLGIASAIVMFTVVVLVSTPRKEGQINQVQEDPGLPDMHGIAAEMDATAGLDE